MMVRTPSPHADGGLRDGRGVHHQTRRGHVESVTIRRTDDPEYPSGWDYSLHFGIVGDKTLLRYDNAHERSKGHERHAPEGAERIDFPGMAALLDRFDREVDALGP